MLSRTIVSILAALALGAVASTSAFSAAGQLSAKTLTAGMDAVATPQPVSFFARPYPYGYKSWGRCVRYVPVETVRGIAYRRVSACRARH